MRARAGAAAALLVLAVGAAPAAYGAPPQPRPSPAGAPPRPGVYTGRAPEHPGLLSLELYPDQTAILRRVVTLHLPPVETETLRVTLTAGCLAPAPRSVAPCLVATSSASITVTSLQSKQAVQLQWRAEVRDPTAPAARTKSR